MRRSTLSRTPQNRLNRPRRGVAIKRIFTSGPSSAIKLLVLGLLALCLVAINTLTDWLDPVAARLGQLALPFQWVASVPDRTREWSDEWFWSRVEWQEENERLRQELLIYKGQLQRMAAISAENARLRNLLNATELLRDRVLVTELMGVSPDPLTHSITINRGVTDGAYVGQPVLDDRGLMGQVTEVSEDTSNVLLITDASHALPVQVIRNGVRAIAEGTGDFRRLSLRYVSPTVDIREGDQLVSSGLGGRFPAGYPVGSVLSIHRDPGEAFMTVEVEPAANLERSRHLLLVFSEVDAYMNEPEADSSDGALTQTPDAESGPDGNE